MTAAGVVLLRGEDASRADPRIKTLPPGSPDMGRRAQRVGAGREPRCATV
jgi:hypothetical protein